jgi:hypothetical protein
MLDCVQAIVLTADWHRDFQYSQNAIDLVIHQIDKCASGVP